MSAKVPIRRHKPDFNLKLDFNKSLGIPYYILSIVLIATPLVLMLLYSFNDASAGIFQIRFTFSHYTRFFTSINFLNVLGRSFYIAAVATIITLLVAYPLAYLMARSRKMVKVILLSVVTAPMWLNAFLRANALRQVLLMINPNLLGTRFAIILGTVYMFLPFMVLPIFTILQKMDKSLLEGSSDLGANGFQTFIRVILPLSMSGVISGIMMVFLPAATSIVIPHVLGAGNLNVRMVGQMIESIINEGSEIGFGAAIAIIIGLILMVFVWLIRKTDRYGGGLDVKEK